MEEVFSLMEGRILKFEKGDPDIKQHKNIYGNDSLYEKLNNYVYKILPDAFFQVNTDGATLDEVEDAISLFEKSLREMDERVRLRKAKKTGHEEGKIEGNYLRQVKTAIENRA